MNLPLQDKLKLIICAFRPRRDLNAQNIAWKRTEKAADLKGTGHHKAANGTSIAVTRNELQNS